MWGPVEGSDLILCVGGLCHGRVRHRDERPPHNYIRTICWPKPDEPADAFVHHAVFNTREQNRLYRDAVRVAAQSGSLTS